MSEYPKIPGPFKRHVDGPDRNKLIYGAWTSEELALLADRLCWQFTEKVDGTNIRIVWDGHRVHLHGRTDRAQLHPDLVSRLETLFPEEILEQTFGAEPAILYGEGYGAGIQKRGVSYADHKDFILFDVRVGEWWLLRENVEEVADKMGLKVVPLIPGIHDVTAAISAMRRGFPSSLDGKVVEGMVGVTRLGLQRRNGQRIMVKIKADDFYQGA